MPGGFHPPPEIIASWPNPNYSDPPTEGSALVVVCVFSTITGVLLVTARIYSRLFITRAPGIDDLLILVSVAFAVTLATLVVIGNRVYDTGRHIWDVPPTKFAHSTLNIWASEWCYVLASVAVKISVLLFYRRLSVEFSNAFRVATWAGILYNVLYAVGFLMGLLFICSPIKAYWMRFDAAWLGTGHKFRCGNESISLPLSGAFSVIGDFYSTVLPLVLVYNLTLPNRQKMALYGLFAIGLIVVIAGIVRTIMLNKLMNLTYDNTWVLWQNWIWTIVELYLAIIAASAPALKPFFHRFLVNPIVTRRLGYLSESSQRSGGGSGSGSHSKRAHRKKRAWPYPPKTTSADPEKKAKVGPVVSGGDEEVAGKYEMVPVNPDGQVINPTPPLSVLAPARLIQSSNNQSRVFDCDDIESSRFSHLS